MGLNLDEQKAVDRFRQEVVEPSMTKLVILDFWAEWCGPCKSLTPVLEKVAADYADKGVVLAKLNVDEEQFIASQFQVRSIPTVYALFQGQPVADLTQARTEGQLKTMLDQLLAKLPITAGGDGERAAGIFTQIIDLAPDNPAAHSGLVRALVAAGMVAEAEAALAALPEGMTGNPEIARARTGLELLKNRPAETELAAIRAAAAERPADMAAQLVFAESAFAAGDRDVAAETLLKAISTDREWNEGAAKAKLLQIFEAVGLEDPWVAAMRRKLSLILFG
jgi:putative thioredoxin